MSKPKFLLRWWDDKKQAPQTERAKTLELATVRKVHIERSTGNPVHLEVK